MFCPNCGAQLEPDAQYCNSCGAPVVHDAAAKAARPAQPSPGVTAPISYAQPRANYPQPSAAPADRGRQGDQGAKDDEGRGHTGRTIVLTMVATIAALAVAGAALVFAGVLPNPLAAPAGGTANEATAQGADPNDTGAQSGAAADDAKADTEKNDAAKADTEKNDAAKTDDSTKADASAKAEAPAPTSFKGITTATASSTLGTDGINTYDPENVLDGNPSTCWAEGVNSVGVGESITLSGDGEQLFSGFRIRNGYQKSEAIYNNNARATELEVQVDGKKVMTVTPTSNSFTRIDEYSLPKSTAGTSITFVIKKAAVGDRYEDTSISEIVVY